MGEALPFIPRTYQPVPEIAGRESKVVFSLLGMVSDMVLDLDMTVGRARELFTLALYERAERRFRTSTRISLAFDTALRTVKKIKKRYRDNGVEEGDGPLYNLRRKVYFMLLEKEMDLEAIARRLPINYEVNYARLSVETLMDRGLVEELQRGRGKVTYRALNPSGHHVQLNPEDTEHLIDGFDRFLGSLRKLASQRLLQGNVEEALARRFIVRVRPQDLEELRDELRAVVVARLMELEQRAEDLDEGEQAEVEVLLGVVPAGRG